MTKVYVAEILSDSSLYEKEIERMSSQLSEQFLDRFKYSENIKKKYESCSAYYLLSKVLMRDFPKLYESFGKYKIKIDLNGKPHFEPCKVHFSVSHTYGAVAVAVSEEGEIGVDIEKIKDEKSAVMKLLMYRFTGDMYGEMCEKYALFDRESFFEYSIEDITENARKAEKSTVPDEINECDRYYIAWCALESILKCSGLGFAGINQLGDLTEKTEVKGTVAELNDGKYAISFARYV